MGWAEVKKSLIEDDLFVKMNVQKFRVLLAMGLAEMLGVASFVAIGCCSAPTGDHLQIVLAFAFGISTSIAMVNHISGSIINPALVLTAVILGHFSIWKMLYYIVTECIGGVIGAFIAKLLYKEVNCMNFNLSGKHWAYALTAEIGATFVLGMVFCVLFDPRFGGPKRHPFIPFVFGQAVIALALPLAAMSSASMNPARSFGPAIVEMNFQDHWIYWVGPFVGAALAGGFYWAFFDHRIAAEFQPKPETEE